MFKEHSEYMQSPLFKQIIVPLQNLAEYSKEHFRDKL
jgi:hypothetical protein